MSEFKYWAFITYSHEDTAWCEWLHKALETYRLPRQLVGLNRDGVEIPTRLFPVFRDREELASGADLGDRIEAALDLSRNLIVLCSPHAARSNWVNEEVRYFKKTGRADRVFCFIVDGEPNVDLVPDAQAEECYPPAVRFALSETGELTAQRVDPLAADARSGKDERRNALLKLIAGIINVEYDELRRRAAERRNRFLALTSISLFALVVALSLLSWSAYTGQQKALKNQSQLLLSAAMFHIENDETHLAIDNLSRAIEIDNNNKTAVYRLISLLTQRSFPVVESDYKIFDDSVWSISRKDDELLVRSRSGLISRFDPPSGRIDEFTDKLVKDIEFWPERDLVITGDAYGRVTLREPGTYQKLGAFSTRGAINDVAISRQNSYFATASSTGQVTVWKLPPVFDGRSSPQPSELTSSTPISGLKRNTVYTGEPATAVVFADAHDWLLTASGRELTIWDIGAPGEAGELHRFGHFGELEAILYVNRYNLIISAARTGVVTMFDADSPDFRSQTFEMTGIPRALKLSRDQQLLVCGTTDGEISVWDLGKRRIVYRVETRRGAISDIDFIDDRSIVVTSWDGVARVYRIQHSLPRQEAARHASPVLAVRMDKDKRRFFTGTVEGRVKQWKYGDKKFHFDSIVLPEPVDSTRATLSREKVLITPEAKEYVYVLDISAGKARKISFESSVISADISPGGDYIIALLEDNRVYRHRLSTHESELIVDNPQVTRVRFLRNSNLVLMVYLGRAMRVWDIENRHPVTLVMRHENSLLSAHYDSNNDRLVSIADDGSMRTWSALTGLPEGPEKPLGFVVDRAVLGPSGKYLYAIHGKMISRIDVDNGLQVSHRYSHPDAVWTVDVNQSENILVSTCFDGIVRIWSVDNDLEALRQLAHGNIAVAAEFSDDGRRVLTGSYEGVINVWDVESGDRIADQLKPGGNLLWAGFDSNDDRIISVTRQGEVAVNETGLSLDVSFPDWLPGLARLLISEQESRQGDKPSRTDTSAHKQFTLIENGDQEWSVWRQKVLNQNLRNR